MTSENSTIVQFSGLKSGRYEYGYVLDNTFFERYENEELRDGKVIFHVILERRERMLLFTFTFEGTVKSICDRCLGEIEVPVKGEETLCVKFSDTEESDDENVVFLPENAYQIDLAQWMYEYVAVSMPMQRLHPEGQCDEEMLKYISEEREESDDTEIRELEDGEVDSRWAVLKNLLENNK